MTAAKYVCWSHEEILGIETQCSRPRWHKGLHASFHPDVPLGSPVLAWHYDPSAGDVVLTTTTLTSSLVDKPAAA